MAWSIFDYPNGDAVATVWAVMLLEALGLQATPARLQFVYDWERSEGGGGAYNPLNQGPVPNNPSLTSSGQQFGGGAANFVSWQAGIAGAVDYLQMPNFQPVLAALQGGDYNAMTRALWNSPWAASHYGYGSNWATSNYVGMAPAEIAQIANSVGMPDNIGQVAMQETGGGTGGQVGSAPQPAGAANPAGQPLSLADMPQVIKFIQSNWPQFAWLLNIPQVASIIENAAVTGEDANQVQAAIEASTWWKTTSSAMRQFEQDMFTNPADYSFTVQGSKAQQEFAQIVNTAATVGVTISSQQAQQLALNALKFGWSAQQIQQAIGALVNPQNAQTVDQQINNMANQYYQTLSPQSLEAYAKGVAGGTTTMQEVQAAMAQRAAMHWTGYSQQLLAGNTMEQLTDNLRQEAAKTMEIDPSSINFTSDPRYMKIIDYSPPAPTGSRPGTQETHRVMTLSEMDQYLKGLPQWGLTQQARDSAATLEQQITQDFGKAPTSG